jgi:hypothetical protein
MNTREFDAAMHEQSTKRVRSGKTPTPRLNAPTCYSNAESSVFIASGRSGAVRAIGWGSGTKDSPALANIDTKRNLTSAEIAAFFTATSLLDVFFVDRASLIATVKLLTASKIGVENRVGRVVKYLSTQPAMSRCSVLTVTLAQKYWTPADFETDNLEAWAALLGKDATTSRYECARMLSDVVRTGELAVIPTANFRTSANIIANALLRWSGAKVEAFTALQNHSDLWEAVCGSDPLLYKRGLLVGSTARIVPMRLVDGGVVEAEVSMPFKLRPGNNITVFGSTMTKGLPVRLSALDFDNESGKLIAKIVSLQKRKKGEQNGFFYLSVEENFGKEFFAINEPFAGGGFNALSPKSKKAEGERRARDLPLDVSLAASV